MAPSDHHINQLFADTTALIQTIEPVLSPLITQAGCQLVNCLLNDGKILICGNGGSAANCLHFSSALLDQLGVEKPCLPVIALNTDMSTVTAIAISSHFDHIFSRQIQALGQAGDVLIALSTSGNSANILQAVNAARDKGMDIIALTGKNGGFLANQLQVDDIEIRIISEKITQIYQMHLFTLHCFCDFIDQSLFGQTLE